MPFTYRVEHQDGTPAEPRKLSTAVPNCSGDTIPLGAAGPCAWSRSAPGSERTAISSLSWKGA